MTTATSDYLSERKRPRTAGLWQRQILGILRLEVKKYLIGRRALGLYFLAFAPVALLGLWSITPLPEEVYGGPSETFNLFATLYVFYLRVPIFLSTLLMFMSLFRAEILERSLHYYFLTPVRREVLVVGKYLSALVATWLIFILGTMALYFFVTMPWGLGPMGRYFFQGPGLANCLGYMATATFAVAGYGAVFLLVGQFFKNPVVPGAIIWLWEAANPLLPATLKKVSVIYYLQAFYPVPPPEEAFPGVLAFLRVLAEPPPVWLSILGLIGFTGLVLVASGCRARTMEVAYGDD